MKPVVHVLMATYNGERHLAQQWASIEGQEAVDVVMHLADDGSTDDTVAVLEELAAHRSGAIREVHWLRAPPRRSATKSFLQLLELAVRGFPEGAWFAFCDQDDIWLPGKLASAIEAVAHAGQGVPALYGGRTLSVDEEDRSQGLSPLFVKPPCFRNAIVQSILGGNTMVMNRAAALLVAQSARAGVTAHDWFSYQLISGVGGLVRYDARAFLRYRQHSNNSVGSNIGWAANWRRFKRMARGEYKHWNEHHVAALQDRADKLTPDNRAVFEAFYRARRSANPLARLRWLRRSGVFRQTLAQQLTLWAACLLGRI